MKKAKLAEDSLDQVDAPLRGANYYFLTGGLFFGLSLSFLKLFFSLFFLC
jgi:hypothetical protein